MNTATLMIEYLTRLTDSGEEETLEFKPGVNVIVGIPNTGKSMWLRMVDYWLGDSGTVFDAIGLELSEKYSSLIGKILISGESHVVERHWKKSGYRGKIVVDGEALSPEAFSEFLLARLGIPEVHFPKGNPFSPRSWPTLSWRSLFRHMYRQWRYWGDIADAQPPADQLACLLMFLGAAELVFSQEYGEVVAKHKEIIRLQASKEEFDRIFTTIYRQLVEGGQNVVAPTKEAISASTDEVQRRIADLGTRRSEIVASMLAASDRTLVQDYAQSIGKEWERLQQDRSGLEAALSAAEARLSELTKYRSGIATALKKLERARSAGNVLADIRVKQCPACDQPVVRSQKEDGNCFLCHQPIHDPRASGEFRERRLDFEHAQLAGELEEADELIAAVRTDRDSTRERRAAIEMELRLVEARAKPLRRAAAIAMPPELGELDNAIGSLQEQKRNLERLSLLLELRDDHSEEIDQLTGEISRLDAAIARKESGLNLEQRADTLATGMIDYLNGLNRSHPRTWEQGQVTLRLAEKRFSFLVNDGKWSTRLGGTLSHYFLLSYHYGLMSLVKKPGCHYPGLAIIDFPPAREEAESIADKENFVLEPFVQLLGHPDMEQTQLIAAGAAFEGLRDANRIQLTKQWNATTR